MSYRFRTQGETWQAVVDRWPDAGEVPTAQLPTSEEIKMPLFERYIGIDYSGAAEPDKPVNGLRVFVAGRERAPEQERDDQARSGLWSRERLAVWLRDRLQEEVPTIVGIDHAFSYPLEAMDGVAPENWDGFLEWFEARWLTRKATVRECLGPHEKTLTAHKETLRLTDRWAPTAMPLCSGWEGKGPNVFFSTHAGIPWLRWLRQEMVGTIDFWPFDGFEVRPGRSVVAEVYPRIFRRRYERETELLGDQRDAWLVCRWLQDRDAKNLIGPYFRPPLDESEERQALVEGWILGVA